MFNHRLPKTEEDEKNVRRWTDPDDDFCPLYDFIGNRKQLNRLARAGYKAMFSPLHIVEQNFAFIGPASCGKTMLARLFGKMIGNAFIEISPNMVKTVDDLVKIMNATFRDKYRYEMIPDTDKTGNDTELVIPPCILFLDEIHAFNSKLIQELLKATEPNDGIVHCKGWEVDFRNVTWIIATTDRGLLFDAFDTRFSKVMLDPPSRVEIQQIIEFSEIGQDFSDEQLEKISDLAPRIPREALEFVKEFNAELEMNQGPWEEALARVADENGLIGGGMTKQRLEVMKQLLRGPVSKKRLAGMISVKEEELEKFVMPGLLYAKAPDPGPLVQVASRGYSLSPAGIVELAERDIITHDEQKRLLTIYNG